VRTKTDSRFLASANEHIQVVGEPGKDGRLPRGLFPPVELGTPDPAVGMVPCTPAQPAFQPLVPNTGPGLVGIQSAAQAGGSNDKKRDDDRGVPPSSLGRGDCRAALATTATHPANAAPMRERFSLIAERLPMQIDGASVLAVSLGLSRSEPGNRPPYNAACATLAILCVCVAPESATATPFLLCATSRISARSNRRVLIVALQSSSVVPQGKLLFQRFVSILHGRTLDRSLREMALKGNEVAVAWVRLSSLIRSRCSDRRCRNSSTNSVYRSASAASDLTPRSHAAGTTLTAIARLPNSLPNDGAASCSASRVPLTASRRVSS
jgi:hypothetical protein